ncbi:MAG TPA: deoxyribonuclease V [Syntrophales bacterium]|nr:deoxyribonuclease V [Syntrophales bacterium]HOX94948.1 deoxyribonuclease V [Syntrophales bacterium]HPI58067.1 deoxyribonuclease V [Syntrophales bacterium]HPN25283.1 deoxyribonuclease V [Syntrophales bacterium]HQM29298.1 deoxyribonuclease V [Syntrophales bacterium]
MKVRRLHPWDVTPREAVKIQRSLREKLRLNENLLSGRIRYVGGADISYTRGDDRFFAAVVILEWPSLRTVEEATHFEKVRFPYIPGLLSFREGPPLIRAFEKLNRAPDVVLFDGQGIAHPRGLGLASHMGLLLSVASVGCAKTKLVGEHDEVGEATGDYAELFLEGRAVGAVVRTKERVKPIYVSQGHRVGFLQSIRLALSCCRGYRIPEPVRQAHLLVNRMRRLSSC